MARRCTYIAAEQARLKRVARRVTGELYSFVHEGYCTHLSAHFDILSQDGRARHYRTPACEVVRTPTDRKPSASVCLHKCGQANQQQPQNRKLWWGSASLVQNRKKVSCGHRRHLASKRGMHALEKSQLYRIRIFVLGSQPAQNRKSQTSQSQITTTVVVSFQNRNSESQTESQNVSAPHQFVSCYLQNHNSKYITSPKMVSTPSLVFFGLFHITFPRYHQQPSLHPSTLLNTKSNHGLVN